MVCWLASRPRPLRARCPEPRSPCPCAGGQVWQGLPQASPTTPTPELLTVCVLRALQGMIEGGPCAHCGATQASIWYGKRDKEKYCKRSECMRAGGYLAPKLTKAMKRRRVQTELTPVKLEAETYSLEATIEELKTRSRPTLHLPNMHVPSEPPASAVT